MSLLFCRNCYTPIDLEDERHPPWLPRKCMTCTLEAVAIEQTTRQHTLAPPILKPVFDAHPGRDLSDAWSSDSK